MTTTRRKCSQWATVPDGRTGDHQRRPEYPHSNRCSLWLSEWDMRCDPSAGRLMLHDNNLEVDHLSARNGLASGYWQVSLSPEARCKTAFATHSGLFQFRVMPFGLCNAPATFERLMDQVLQGLRWSRCLVYLDDIISFGATFGDALDNLTSIFERLRLYGLQLKSTKCHLFQTSVPFLGHVIGRRGLECDPKKIEDVRCWSVPDCLKSVRQFLGSVGYYRRFIPCFADIAEPLVALTGKDVPFVWRPECATAFLRLRDALVRAPM